ncbi:MAG TPA: peptidylprolyl isomerase [Oscillospiraceae bacterium]|nr:peptidylprolyl isomerase [Oscillospiraceae bacterium]
MANEKSKAEQYRDERKARIAKSAKKNAHSMEARNTAKKVANKVISIVLCAVIVLGVVAFSLNYYGALQRVIKIGGVGSDQSVSIAEYEYYYMRAYNQVRYQAQYYQYYYQTSNGYDLSLTPEEQTQTTKDADGNEITWAEKLHEDTLEIIQLHKAYYNEALKMGLKLTKADEAFIDKQIEDLRDEAKSAGSNSSSSNSENKVTYSLNAYLRKVYGGSINERFLRKQLKIQVLAQKYLTERTNEIAKDYDQKDIDAEYKKDTTAYDFVTFRAYTFKTTELTKEDNETDDALKARQAKANAEVKKNANDFYNAVTNDATFTAKAKELNKDTADYNVDKETKYSMLKSTAQSTFSEDAAKWLFDSSTKVGSKKLFSDEENGKYIVVLALSKPHQEQTVTARHILFQTKDQNSGNDLSEEEIAKKKTQAEDVLKKFNEGDKTEDSFAALANEYNEDTGSSSNGGLYEHIYPGQMVTEFNDWVFDANRKAGDVELVETDFGYHIIYFVAKDGKDYYDSAIRSSKANKDIETETKALQEGKDYVVGLGPRRMNYAEKRVLKKIKYLVELSNANSSSSAR